MQVEEDAMINMIMNINNTVLHALNVAQSSSDLEVLHQASAGDFAAVDFLHIDVTGTEEPGNQNPQVVYKLAVDF